MNNNTEVKHAHISDLKIAIIISDRKINIIAQLKSITTKRLNIDKTRRKLLRTGKVKNVG